MSSAGFNPEDFDVKLSPAGMLGCEMCAFAGYCSCDSIFPDLKGRGCLALAVQRGELEADYNNSMGGRSHADRIYLELRDYSSLPDLMSFLSEERPAVVEGPFCVTDKVSLAVSGDCGCRYCWRAKDDSVYKTMPCDCLERAKQEGFDVRDAEMRSRVYLEKV